VERTELSEQTISADPLEQFHRWYREAEAAGAPAEGMALATATADGAPSVRMVLLKGADERGFVFHTNYRSRKGLELAANPRAALLFHWRELGRQVRVEGRVEQVAEEESNRYFATRPPESRVGTWASEQSTVISSRKALDERVESLRAELGPDPGRPPFWGGFRLRPERYEFWQHRDNRLHDRLCFVRKDGGWRLERLAP
jgi:pyridoxamine 5'-phosphate oxidase